MRRSLIGLTAILTASTAHASGAVSPYAYKLFEIPGLGLPVTNSMVMLWVITLSVILVVRIAVSKSALVPSTGQAIVEMIVESVENLIEPIVGETSGAAHLLAAGRLLFCDPYQQLELTTSICRNHRNHRRTRPLQLLAAPRQCGPQHHLCPLHHRHRRLALLRAALRPASRHWLWTCLETKQTRRT